MWQRTSTRTGVVRLLLAQFCLTIGLSALAFRGACGEEPAVDYARDIQPLFEKNCYQCHGAKKQESGLRLDVRSRALKGGDSGDPAVVPNQCEKSQLLARVSSDDPEERMPPKDHDQPLAKEEIALLRSWIEQGAAWPDSLANEPKLASEHWAFKAPVRPPVPELSNSDWVRDTIDNFVLARLQSEQLQPSPETDRVTLIRRLCLDLTGLPPTVEEVDAFLADKSDDAYEHLIDRLLASPHYGERWGRLWLDAARYADSNGYEKDMPREVWFYRDWVIDAINRDLPYDQFVIQQIAGDQLPNATQQQIVATGFLRNSMVNEEGGVDPEEFRTVAMFDRMDTIGKSVLGLTIQCAQCHNHKYDPLTQEEYYRMLAFLNNANEANIAVYSPADEQQRAEIYRKISEIESDLKERTPDWQQQMAVWEAAVRDNQPQWTVVRPEIDDNSTGGEKILPQDDGSFLAQGSTPSGINIKLTVRTDVHPITAFRLELLTDANLPHGGPGRSPLGVATLSEFSVEAADSSAPDKCHKIKFRNATADFNPPGTAQGPADDKDKSGKQWKSGPVDFAIDDNPLTAWGTDAGPGRRNQPRKAVFVAEEPINYDDGAMLTCHLSQLDAGQQHNIGCFRLSITSAAGAVADPLPAAARQVLVIPSDQRTPTQVNTLFSYWRTTVKQWQDANDQIEKLWKDYPEGSSQLVLTERDKPRPTYVLKRGDFLKPDREVSPGVPSFLHPLPEGSPSTRLTFAHWLVDRRSPTAARAIVNRIWQAYFGIGLVNTSEDLGSQSELPSHPALLDWLAVEFMDHDWSLKYLHRLIVTSATYRQASHVSAELYQRDPYNRLLARGPRFRVDGEAVRDIQLAASGLLSLKIGGASVYPPMPEFLLHPPYVYSPKIWTVSTGEDRYRRAMYTFRYRSLLYPMLQTFDTPNGEFSCVRRARSNTPLQALMTLNEPVSVECAQALARKTLEQTRLTDDAARLSYAFRRCVARVPTASETEKLLQFYQQQKKRVAEGWLDPWQLVGAEAEAPKIPNSSTPTELAAWTCVARVLLNLDETITKD